MDTFVVRVYPVEDDEAGLASRGAELLRGVVSRVASGETVAFRSTDELVAFLVDHRGGPVVDAKG